MVGWPPVKPWRKKRVCWWHGNSSRRAMVVENGCGCGSRVSKSMHVKVKMDGVAIARKVDLSLHHSFHTLLHTFMDMFGKCKFDSAFPHHNTPYIYNYYYYMNVKKRRKKSLNRLLMIDSFLFFGGFVWKQVKRSSTIMNSLIKTEKETGYLLIRMFLGGIISCFIFHTLLSLINFLIF